MLPRDETLVVTEVMGIGCHEDGSGEVPCPPHGRNALIKILVGLVAIASLAGCSSSSSPKSAATSVVTTPPVATSTAAPSPSPTPSPTPTLWSVAVAQQQYLAEIAPGNADGVAINKLLDEAQPSLGALTALYTKLASDEDTLARALSAGLWPANVRPKVDALITATTESRTIEMTAGEAKSFTELNQTTGAASWNDVIDAGGSAAEAVRVALGLPGNS
jgi:hypothetical protein